MTKERVKELDRLIAGAIADCEVSDNHVDGSILEFWRGAKMIVDELKMGMLKMGMKSADPIAGIN